MKSQVHETAIPPGSEISRRVGGAYFHDCFTVSGRPDPRTAMEIYLETVARSPKWVERLMRLRNRLVSLVGLKDLGAMGAIDKARPASDYRVGDRSGIFSILYLTDNEVILGDSDRHLDVQVSVWRSADGADARFAVSTVVHVHNLLGRIYMFFVAPAHKRIVPAVIGRLRTQAAV